MIIDIVRHAESEGNKLKMLQGQFNSQLSENGRLQAKSLGEILDFPYNGVYSSPLDRALETAKISIFGKYSDQIIEIEGLQEMSFGLLEQVHFSEFSNKQADMWNKMKTEVNYKEHEGESGIEFYNRVISSIEYIIEESKKKNHQKILLFTHGGVIRILFQFYLKLEKPFVKNTQIMRFCYSKSRLTFQKQINF
ncbi:MAG: putative phosphoserine phosphatase 2 [Candidatus Heimdallarchaeota archaeon LC_2]|nr:MAG: putative phosphoserine phosphatase 2 [Candidatus Heimdallarchaeota archaeon LC_2]